jgi:hypothetical protein
MCREYDLFYTELQSKKSLNSVLRGYEEVRELEERIMTDVNHVERRNPMCQDIRPTF